MHAKHKLELASHVFGIEAHGEWYELLAGKNPRASDGQRMILKAPGAAGAAP